MKKVYITIVSLFFACTIDAQNYMVSTAAGSGAQGLVDSSVADCEMYWPYGLASDNDSLVYFSDGANNAVRKFNYMTNVVTTIAGDGTAGFQDGQGASARFYYPDALFVKDGFLYVSDNLNNAVRKIDLSNNMVTTIAGNGTPGFRDGVADSSLLRNPGGIVVDSLGDVYFSDCYNFCIRKISNGVVSTIAGVPEVYGYQDGPANTALFHRPRYICLDSNGVMYITDIHNNVVRKFTNGMVSTFAGTGVAGGLDGADSVATFSAPVGIASTYNNFLYVVDGGGNKLRKIDTAGNVLTIAGDGNFGFIDGPADTAEFFYPQGVCYDEYGFIYMADRNNNRIRKISLPSSEARKHLTTTNIVKSNAAAVSVSPNPTSGIVNVNTNSASSYVVYNTIGSVVKSGNLNHGSNQLDISDLSTGIYTIVFMQGDRKSISKISLQK
ncbi:MAG: T9SS type A sorting domain-containing protein [Bacteroidia bacterium]